MSNLQLALIVAGVALVVGVVIFNWWQERRIRRRIDAAFRPAPVPTAKDAPRVEPTLRARDRDGGDVPAPSHAGGATLPANVARDVEPAESSFVPPMDVIESMPVQASAIAMHDDMRSGGPQPDPDIECIVTLQPAQSVGPGAIAAGLTARLGKPLRWFGHRGNGVGWVPVAKDTVGTFDQFAACLLLADRNGPISRAQLETFARVVGEIAQTLPAAFAAPDIEAEAARAETLDALCADLDVQIGLSIVKPDTAPIAGTRLRGVAEAAGFRLAPGGRFEYMNEESGTVEYSLQNTRSEPFTADSLRLTATNGVVFLLDVPRLADPVRSFDRMKLAAKRMAHTLGGELVDDNQRPLDDAALAKIRAQVDAAAGALKSGYIEPGSPRALALFGA
ncbi:MAG TPA: cell division protein ZipA C-terminal FtsZ-binding domain-containing protein [Casimicrobiaceae bacterium]|nr:cell division protein ZipA C-terminal FtsZ-binding domain-containing protein [Casimicrobiaceae bacterium]